MILVFITVAVIAVVCILLAFRPDWFFEKKGVVDKTYNGHDSYRSPTKQKVKDARYDYGTYTTGVTPSHYSPTIPSNELVIYDYSTSDMMLKRPANEQVLTPVSSPEPAQHTQPEHSTHYPHHVEHSTHYQHHDPTPSHSSHDSGSSHSSNDYSSSHSHSSYDSGSSSGGGWDGGSSGGHHH